MRSGLLTWKARGALWLRLGIRLSLILLTLWLLSRFGRRAFTLFAPFLCAFLTAVLLNPPIRWLQRRLGWSRRIAALLLILASIALLGTALGFLGYAIGQELLNLTQNWDLLLSALQTTLEQVEQLFSRVLQLLPPQILAPAQLAAEELLTWLGSAVPDALTELAAQIGHRAMGIPSFLISTLMFVLAAYFLSADYPYLRSRAAQYMSDRALRFCRQIRTTALGAFGGYLKAQLLLSAGVFFILLTGFFLTRQPYGLLLALGLAVLDFIPLVGAGTVMVPWAFIALLSRDYSTAAGILLISGAIALFRRAMEPKFVGDQTGLPPLLSLVGIYVGMKLGGVPGMILGPILLLILLNLSGMGLFRGLHLDLTAAVCDIAAILSERPFPP